MGTTEELQRRTTAFVGFEPVAGPDPSVGRGHFRGALEASLRHPHSADDLLQRRDFRAAHGRGAMRPHPCRPASRSNDRGSHDRPQQPLPCAEPERLPPFRPRRAARTEQAIGARSRPPAGELQ
jgi:hypothetical protein